MGSDVRTIALVVIMTILGVAALVLARDLFVPLAVGVLLSYMLEPAVARLVKWRVPRAISATLVFLFTIGFIAATAYSLRHQAVQAIDQLPTVAQELRETVQKRVRWRPRPVTQVERAAAELQKLSGAPKANAAVPVRVAPEPHLFSIPETVWAGSVTATALLADLTVIVVLAYYLLLAGDFFRRRLVEIAGPTLSDKKITLQILEEISAQIERYIFVRALISLIVGTLTAALLWIIGLSQPGLWGVVAGLANVVPYVGSGGVAIAAALAGFVTFQTITMGVATGAAVVAVAVLEAYVLTPWLTSRASAMNAPAVFIGLIFWGWVWGLPGLLLAVPLLMVTKAVCDHVDVLQPIARLLGE